MDDDIDPEVIIKKTADFLMAAGEVIAQIRKREEEDGGSYEGGDLLERVQVAQVLILVASGESSKKSIEESRKRIEESRKRFGSIQDDAAAEARRTLERVQRRAAMPEPIPMPEPPRPRVVEARPLLPDEAQKAMNDAIAKGPHPDRDEVVQASQEDEQLQISVYREGDRWTVTTFTSQNMIQREARNIEELARELGHAAAMVHKMKTDKGT